MFRPILLIAVFALLTACAQYQPIFDVHDHPVTTMSGQTPTASEVRGAIARAATKKTWRVKDIDDSHMEATVNVRSHTATVVIVYSPTSYSITYKDSDRGLWYNDMINERYNSWVKGLSITIDKELAKLRS